ncbi:hypothetical protein GGF31_006139 [Allomyces arbusculus]|nr:hypothetical protein GGF31_006139 [Allomyces arbusculus]
MLAQWVQDTIAGELLAVFETGFTCKSKQGEPEDPVMVADPFLRAVLGKFKFNIAAIEHQQAFRDLVPQWQQILSTAMPIVSIMREINRGAP